MEACFEVRSGVVLVELKGRLDFESTEPFRKTCLERLIGQKIVFDMQDLVFVGSLGLTEFVDTLDQMAKKSSASVKFCGLSSEFRRLFEASGISNLQIFEDSARALQSFQTPLSII